MWVEVDVSNPAIGAIVEHLAKEAAAHWQDCLDARLPDHSSDAHAEVDRSISEYFERLQTMPHDVNDDEVLDAIRLLFLKLDRIAARFGDGLLETDERELFVPAVNGAAEIADLDVTKFANSDATLEFRNF